MAGRTDRLLAFFGRTEPPGAAPSGWALALDAAVAVGAAAGAVYEMAVRTFPQPVLAPVRVFGPSGVPLARPGDILVSPFGVTLTKPGEILIAPGGSAHASLLMLVGAALTALPLALRRVYPISVCLAIAAAIVAVHSVYVPPVALGTAVYAAYSAITYSRYRNLAIAVVSVVTVLVAVTLGNELPRFPGRLTAIFAIVPAAAAGLGIRVLRRRLADSTARLRRAADEARVATQRALAAERARIASELHDVVTHNVSVMIVQAGAARKIMASSPADAEDALLAVEATGREAMTELRNLLGLLSPVGGASDSGAGLGAAAAGTAAAVAPAGTAGAGTTAASGTGATATQDASAAAASGAGAGAASGAGVVAARGVAAAAPGAGAVATSGTDAAAAAAGVGTRAVLRPQPRLTELDALIERVTATGLPVELTVTGTPRPLPPGADLAAYRVVQEGLTNVLRHAGQATASVAVNWDEGLVITVTDDGQRPILGGQTALAGEPGPPGDCVVRASGAGRGLLGLRERLALYGGELSAGPRPDGGWLLRAVLPAELP